MRARQTSSKASQSFLQRILDGELKSKEMPAHEGHDDIYEFWVWVPTVFEAT